MAHLLPVVDPADLPDEFCTATLAALQDALADHSGLRAFIPELSPRAVFRRMVHLVRPGFSLARHYRDHAWQRTVWAEDAARTVELGHKAVVDSMSSLLLPPRRTPWIPRFIKYVASKCAFVARQEAQARTPTPPAPTAPTAPTEPPTPKEPPKSTEPLPPTSPTPPTPAAPPGAEETLPPPEDKDRLGATAGAAEPADGGVPHHGPCLGDELVTEEDTTEGQARAAPVVIRPFPMYAEETFPVPNRRVFICHKSADKPVAVYLHLVFQMCGFDTFFDVVDCEDVVYNEVRRGVIAAEHVVCVVGGRFFGKWPQREIATKLQQVRRQQDAAGVRSDDAAPPTLPVTLMVRESDFAAEGAALKLRGDFLPPDAVPLLGRQLDDQWAQEAATADAPPPPGHRRLGELLHRVTFNRTTFARPMPTLAEALALVRVVKRRLPRARPRIPARVRTASPGPHVDAGPCAPVPDAAAAAAPTKVPSVPDIDRWRRIDVEMLCSLLNCAVKEFCETDKACRARVLQRAVANVRGCLKRLGRHPSSQRARTLGRRPSWSDTMSCKLSSSESSARE